MNVESATYYVDISRDDLENWLNSLGYKWSLMQNTAGMYLIHLSDNVAILLSSTIGSRNEAMGKGKASMNLALVSRHSYKVLNRKAMKQKHFKRTKNWRTTWSKGVGRMYSTYISSQTWYDKLAVIEDRGEYSSSWISKIEEVRGWSDNDFLKQLYMKLSKGSVLSDKQEQAILRMIYSEAPKEKEKAQEPDIIQQLRDLYKAAATNRSGKDVWTMDFAKSLASRVKSGRPLSISQRKVLNDKFYFYRIDNTLS